MTVPIITNRRKIKEIAYFLPRFAGRLLPYFDQHKYSPRLRSSRTFFVVRNGHRLPNHPSRQPNTGSPIDDSAVVSYPRISNMLSHVDVVSTPTADTPGACLRLCFDNRHYVFGNVSEGTQRIMASKRQSMSKVEDIFLTGPVDWHANGGLLGFLLTISDVHESIGNAMREANEEKKAKGKKVDPVRVLDHVNIHGARNLAHMLATARRFVFRKAFPLVPLEVRTDPRQQSEKDRDSKPDWEDDNIRVWYVPVQSDKGAAAATADQASKSKKRKAEHLSDSDGETIAPASAQSNTGFAEKSSTTLTPTDQDEIDQQVRLGVVRRMFNAAADRQVGPDYQTVNALGESTLGKTTPRDMIYSRQLGGRRSREFVLPYTGPMDLGANILVRRDWNANDVLHLPPVEASHVSLCYVVKVHRGRGKFNAAMAGQLGVAKQDSKRLVAGETVIGKDGAAVTPEMVMSPPPPPGGFVLVEVPDASYVDGLLARPEWENEGIMSGLAAMYWIFRKPEVLGDERVQAFMREKSTLKHIVLSRTEHEGGSPCLIQNSAVERTRLNMVDGDLFPSVSHTDGDGSFAVQTREDATLPYELGLAGARLLLKPKVLTVYDQVVGPVKQEEVMEKFLADPEILKLASEAKSKVTDPAFLASMAKATANLPNPDTEVIPLGTGSALPSRSRNVSCTLIRVPGVGSYLLDCGENSLGQLRRMYGYEGADEVLRDLKAVWISHSHADHHLGTVSVLKRFSEVVPLSSNPETQQGLAMIAHPLYHQFLVEYAQLEPIGLGTHVVLISTSTVKQPPDAANSFARNILRPLADPAILSRFGLQKVAMCKVDHCEDAHAMAFTLTSGLKIAYSGDCRPSRGFASASVGGGAHLLIHEATLDDELQKDAVMKKHCTTSEALGVAAEMRARNVLLTHFSQRYPKLPEVGRVKRPDNDGGEGGEEEGGEEDVPVLFAFDFMRVRLGEFRVAREYLGPLQRLYADAEKEVKDEESKDEESKDGEGNDGGQKVGGKKDEKKKGEKKKGEKKVDNRKNGKNKEKGAKKVEENVDQVVEEVLEDVIQEVEEKVILEKTADV